MFPHFTDSTAELWSLLLGIAFDEYEGSNESWTMMLAQLKSTCVLVDTLPYYLTFFLLPDFRMVRVDRRLQCLGDGHMWEGHFGGRWMGERLGVGLGCVYVWMSRTDRAL